MKSVQCEIKGLSPLLMNRFPMEPVEGLSKKLPREQTEVSAYRMPDTGELYIPGVAMHRSMVNAAVYSKGKGRSSLKKIAACCIFVTPEYLLLGTSEYVIDARPVVIPATKGRVIKYRPRLDSWSVKFSIDYDDTLLKANEVRDIVDNAGKRVGLLDFRPERFGPFGRFIVTSWD